MHTITQPATETRTDHRDGTRSRLAERAAVMLGAAEAARESVGTPLTDAERVDADRAREAAITALGDEAFAASLAAGRATDPSAVPGLDLS